MIEPRSRLWGPLLLSKVSRSYPNITLDTARMASVVLLVLVLANGSSSSDEASKMGKFESMPT